MVGRVMEEVPAASPGVAEAPAGFANDLLPCLRPRTLPSDGGLAGKRAS